MLEHMPREKCALPKAQHWSYLGKQAVWFPVWLSVLVLVLLILLVKASLWQGLCSGGMVLKCVSNVD